MTTLDADLAKLQAITGTVDVPFDTKSITDSGTLILRGIAGGPGRDLEDEDFDAASFRAAYEKYLSGGSPVVALNHNLKQILGRITSGQFRANGEAEVIAEIPKPPDGAPPEIVNAYQLIKAGVLRCFSVGGKWLRLPGANGVSKLYPQFIHETSICGVGVNGNAQFELIGTKSMDDADLDAELSRLAALNSGSLDRELAALRGLAA